MHRVQPSIEVSSLSALGDLILIDERSASDFFSRLCGLDAKEGRCAIQTFQARVSADHSWLELLSGITPETASESPELIMQLLTEAFGLYEIDAMDVIIRLCNQSPTCLPAHLAN